MPVGKAGGGVREAVLARPGVVAGPVEDARSSLLERLVGRDPVRAALASADTSTCSPVNDKPRRCEQQPPRLGQPLGHRKVDQPRPGAKPQELAHRGERVVDRPARTQSPASRQRGFDEVLEPAHGRQADRGQLDSLAGAPAKEARYPSGIDLDRVGRTGSPCNARRKSPASRCTRYPGNEHHPQLRSIQVRPPVRH
jgi:hypothetical protein